MTNRKNDFTDLDPNVEGMSNCTFTTPSKEDQEMILLHEQVEYFFDPDIEE